MRCPDHPDNVTQSKVGVGELLTKPGVMAVFLHELLVERQGRFQEVPAQVANIECFLLLEQGVLADIGQVVIHGLLGHLEVGFGFLRRRPVDHDHRESRDQGDTD